MKGSLGSRLPRFSDSFVGDAYLLKVAKLTISILAKTKYQVGNRLRWDKLTSTRCLIEYYMWLTYE
jgi:hypothetical protein